MNNINENKIIIRPAVATDANDVAEVCMSSWESAYKDFVPAEYMRERRKRIFTTTEQNLNDEKINHYYYTILLSDIIIGFLVVAPSRDEDTDDSVYEVGAIYLHPEYYRQGIGTQAMEFACNIARALNKKTMIVWVFADNHASIGFYKKCGFTEDGTSRILECGKPLNTIRMRKDL